MPELSPLVGSRARVLTTSGAVDGAHLADFAHGAALDLAASGLGTGDRLAVDARSAFARLIWFLGADLLGAATLVCEPAWTSRERAAVLADARPARLVEHLPEPSSRRVAAAGDEWTRCYLPTTSGSSGRPRVLIRTRASWLRSFDVFDLGLRPDDAVLVPGPLSSSLFLFGALHALHEGRELHLLERWDAAEAAASRATVIHVVPAMLAALLSVLERDPALRDECPLRQVVCGGSRLDAELVRRLGRVLPGCELVEYYGSAEQSLIALGHGGGLRPVVDVEIRDDDGNPLPPEEIGTLWAASGLVFDGYLHHGAVEAPASWRHGWSSVGDRAVLHHDGTLTVHGRGSSTISSGAKEISAEEVEAVLRGADGVTDVVVAGTPHPRLGSLVTAVLESDGTARLDELRARARTALEPGKRPRRWLTMAELPRTAAGKPARSSVAEQLRDATLPAEVLSTEDTP